MSFDEQDLAIPTPENVPQPLNLNHLPTSVLQSQTVEYLLQQNQDLMSRLQITIRRLTDMERQTQELTDKYKTTREQTEYFNNETNLLRDKTRRQELNMQHARSEIAQLEKRMAELYTSTKDYREKLEQENFQLRSDLNHLIRYRRRIQKSVRPMVEQLRERVDHYEQKAYKLETDLTQMNAVLMRLINYRRRIQKYVNPMIRSLKFNMNEAEKQILDLATERSDLKSRLTQSYEHSQTVKAELEEEKVKLVEHYERRINEAVHENEKLKRDLIYYKQVGEDSTKRLENVMETQSRAENKSILLERELDGHKANMQSIRDHYENEFKRLQSEVIRLSNVYQTREQEAATLKKALLHSEERVQRLDFEKREMMAQISGIQALWENTIKNQNQATKEPNKEVPKELHKLDFLEVHKPNQEKIETLLDEMQASDLKQLGDFLVSNNQD